MLRFYVVITIVVVILKIKTCKNVPLTDRRAGAGL